MSYVYVGADHFPSSLTLPDDSNTPNQANFSPGWEGNRDGLIYLRNRQAMAPLINWYTGPGAGATQSWKAFYFQNVTVSNFQLYTRWFTFFSNNTANGGGWAYSYDGGQSWLTMATTGTAINPLNKCLVAEANSFVHFTGTSSVHYGSTSFNTATSSGWNATQGVAYVHPTTGKEYFVGVTQSGGSFTGAAASFSLTGPTIVDKTSALPSQWASGTNHCGEFFTAQNSSHVFVAMGGVTPVTDTARILYAAFDVTAPNDVTPSVTTNQIITGFTYDEDRALFVLQTYNGTDSHVYTNADPNLPNNWVLAFTVTGVKFAGIYAVHSTWALDYPASDIIIGLTSHVFFLTPNMQAPFYRSNMAVDTSFSVFTAAGNQSLLMWNIGSNSNVFVTHAARP